MSTPGTIDRRRVLQGMAWAAPAVIVATAAPASAASGERVAVESLLTPSAVQWQRASIGKPQGANGNWSNAVMVTANISYGTLLAAPTLDTLNAILTYSALQSDPPEFATNGNSGWVAGQVPNGWTLGPVSGTSIVLVRTNVAPGTPIGVMNFAARGTGSSTLTAVTYMGTAGGVPFSKSFAVTP